MTLICFILVLWAAPAVKGFENQEIPGSRPEEAGNPTTVEVGIYVVDIYSIDSVNQTFDANVFILLKWKDSRIPGAGKEAQKILLNRVWNPNILIANESENVRKTFPETVEVNTDGSVLYRQRYIGTFSQPLRLNDFPFDRHTFSIQFVAQGFRNDEIKFIPYSEHFGTEIDDTAGIAKNISLPDWTIIDCKAAMASYEILPTLHIPGYKFQFTAERDSGHYIWKVILPLILIVGMSWIVFWIHPSQSGTQISLAVTSMLTLIAYRFTIDLLVPRVSYMTRMDKFILLATILVFLTLIQANLTGRLYANNKITVAENIDKFCRIFFPVIFILVTLSTLAL